MQTQEYSTRYHFEDDHWCFVGIRDLIHKSISEYFPKKKDLKLLDAGCGTGAFLSSIKGVEGYGIDLFDEAIEFCRKRALRNILKGSICDIPFESDSFDLVVSVDVMSELKKEDDLIALREMKRVLKKNGILILSLPAYHFLRSSHDAAVSELKRYTKFDLEEKLLIEGMEIEKISYRNIVLFPLIFVKLLIDRLLPHKKDDPASGLYLLPKPLNFLFSRVLLSENYFLKHINFPYGLSVFCVARKKDYE